MRFRIRDKSTRILWSKQKFSSSESNPENSTIISSKLVSLSSNCVVLLLRRQANKRLSSPLSSQCYHRIFVFVARSRATLFGDVCMYKLSKSVLRHSCLLPINRSRSISILHGYIVTLHTALDRANASKIKTRHDYAWESIVYIDPLLYDLIQWLCLPQNS